MKFLSWAVNGYQQAIPGHFSYQADKRTPGTQISGESCYQFGQERAVALDNSNSELSPEREAHGSVRGFRRAPMAGDGSRLAPVQRFSLLSNATGFEIPVDNQPEHWAGDEAIAPLRIESRKGRVEHDLQLSETRGDEFPHQFAGGLKHLRELDD